MNEDPTNHPDRTRLRLVTDLPAREDRHLIDEAELHRRLADEFERGVAYGYERGLRAGLAGESPAHVEALGA